MNYLDLRMYIESFRINFKGNERIIYISLSSLITTVTIRESKWLHVKLFIEEDADILLGGLKLAKQGLWDHI